MDVDSFAGDRDGTVDVAAAARWVTSCRAGRRAVLQERLSSARRDADRVIAMIADRYAPPRIYQWGSLLRPHRFSEISDIAIDGIDGDQAWLAEAHTQAEALTRYHVDLVVLQRLEVGRADLIRRFGAIAWRRDAGP